MTETPEVGVSVDEAFLKRLDAWRMSQSDHPSRAEALRRLAEESLALSEANAEIQTLS